MTRHALSGVYAAALTPLKADLSPDLEAVAPFLGFLASRGCHGALLFGTTGEGPSFSLAERQAVWQAGLKVREQYPDFHLLAGTGTPSLTETVDLTHLAFDLGYDAVVTLPPYYFRSASDDGLFAWFQDVIRKAVPGDGFLFGYHFPGTAGIGFSMDLLARLKEAFPVQFAGIKDSSHNPSLASDLGEKFGDELAVFSGTDSYFSLALQNHAAGCITAPANLISPDLRRIYDTFMQGDDPAETQAQVTQKRLTLERFLPFPPLLKVLMARLHQQPRWPVRPPMVAISGTDEEQAALEFAAVN